MRFVVLLRIGCLLGVLASCGSETGDLRSDNGIPPPGGKDKRIRDLVNPTLPDHDALVGTTQAVSGAVVVAVDDYDEQSDGNGTGDIYVQDLAATSETPYAGINLFSPTFSPGNLRASPGDVLDMRGEYQENTRIPSTPPIVFTPGTVLIQFFKPTATFRYETKVPEPIDIDVNDLGSFEKGRRWVGMLVRIKNMTALDDTFIAGKGRASTDITPQPEGGFMFCGPKLAGATLVNALYPTQTLNLKKGDTLKSVTGVVLFFCNLQIAPRSAADIER